MTRRRGKLARSAGKQRRLEGRRQTAPERERRRVLRDSVKEMRRLYELAVSVSHGLWHPQYLWYVCDGCGLLQPARYQEGYEPELGDVFVAPCLSSVLLELDCDSESAITLEHHGEVA